jgi:uncharacterized coiled-coil DUF342 family protein
MERTRWSDERLDERMTAIDATSERGFNEMREMRAEMRAGFERLSGEITGLHRDIAGVHKEIAGVHKEIAGVHSEIADFHKESAGFQKDIAGVHKEISGVHGAFADLHRHVTQIMIGLASGLLALATAAVAGSFL